MSGRRRSNGYALVVVLWLVMLLATIAGGYFASSRVESKLLAQSLYRMQAEGLAEAGIWVMLHDYLATTPDWSTRAPQLERSVKVGDAPVQVTLRDATGYVNLNAAQPELIESVLAYAGVAPADRAALTAAILDWRDLDHAAGPAGAEDADYARDGAANGAKDAPFATIDELRFVRGMTEDVYERIAPLLTLFGDNSRVNVAAAPREVLLALPGADEGVADTILKSRGSSTGEALPERLDGRFTQSGGSDIYVVTATATAGSTTARVRATVRYGRGEDRPFQVLAWEKRRED